MELRGDNYMIIKSCIGVLLSLSIFLPHFTIQYEARIIQEQIKAFRNLEDIGRSRSSSIIKTTHKLKQFKHLGMDPPLDLPNSASYGVGSPFSLAPFDSLAPTPLPQNGPPFCEDPPSIPLPPSTTIPNTPMVYTPPSPPSPSPPFVLTPNFPFQSPPESPFQYPPQSPYDSPPQSPFIEPPQTPSDNPPQSPPFVFPTPSDNTPQSPPFVFPTPSDNPPQSPPFVFPNPPEISPGTPSSPGYIPSPPTTDVPNPPDYYVPSPPSNVPSPFVYVPSPPDYEPIPPMYVPSPIGYTPSPIGYTPSPYGFHPSPPVFQPPVVFPPPSGPPSPFKGPQRALWCVAKPSVPDPIIQEAMNYACGSGADCESIQPEGSCYRPENLFAHASFAFNSYWQRTKAAGGTCDFGGTAILVTVDPSFNGCHFLAT